MLLRSGGTVSREAHGSGRSINLVCCALMGVAAAGCASSGLPVASVTDANHLATADYRLQSGDRLRVTVFDEPTLSGEFEVGLTGAVTLPLISDVAAARQTPQAVAAAISEKLRAGGFVLEPRVAVDVLSHRPIFVLGEVNRPGEYPYEGELTFHQAIAKAGGFTARANRRAIELQRSGGAFHRVIKLDKKSSLLIAPGDTIIIKEAFF